MPLEKVAFPYKTTISTTLFETYVGNIIPHDFSELIYKEVMDLEERTKNGVIRGQPPPLGWLL